MGLYGFMMANQEQNNASLEQLKHVWIGFEDDVLVDCLVELNAEDSYVVDTRFKEGYVTKLEDVERKDSRYTGQGTS